MSEGRRPFEPADGVTPRWRLLYNLVAGKKVGDEITYREAIECLGLEGGGTRRNRGIAQGVMRDAVHRLEKDGLRTVGNRANFGWIVLDAGRELDQVDDRLRKTRRAAVRTMRGVKALSGRREELSQFDRERLDWAQRSASLAQRVASRRPLNMDDLRKAIESGQ